MINDTKVLDGICYSMSYFFFLFQKRVVFEDKITPL